jgi:hypothetical protein
MSDVFDLANEEREVLSEGICGTRSAAFVSITQCAERLKEEMEEEIIDDSGNRNPFTVRSLD